MASIQPSSRAARVALAVGGGLVILYSLMAVTGLGPSGTDPRDVPYYGALLLAAGLTVARGFAPAKPRRTWLTLGLGMTAWCAGDLVFEFALGPDPPTPSVADALYLLLYPAAYTALVLLMRPRLRQPPAVLALDGITAAGAVCALAAAVLVRPVVDALGGDALENTLNLAYPVLDALLLGLVVLLLALTGWRPGRGLVLMSLGFAMLAVADGLFVYTTATGAYRAGLQDVGWPLGFLLLAAAAWHPPVGPARPRSEGWRVVAIPIGFGLVALAVLVVDHVTRQGSVAIFFAAVALLAMLARLAVTFGERAKLLALTRREARTDALTGLRNRRALARDLEVALAEPVPHLLVLFDLNGFKIYNDRFGHPAGDALLGRLGRALQRACEPGRAYRMGGDEFCALLPLTGDRTSERALRQTVAALSESGEGFAVNASWGLVYLPAEAATASEAIGLADRRMYARKRGGRPSAGRQSTDVLLRVMEERQPDLRAHGLAVALLAGRVAAHLGLEDDQREAIAYAAELHDIGKVAIPEGILAKPGPLDEDEWAFVRRHPVIGERIIAGAPALAGVGRLVRCAHERWDGRGYPDGLAGEDIPLGARIVAVCEAWEAMTSTRPDRPAMPREAARTELRRGAGTQWDPRVVEAFLAVEAAPPLVPADPWLEPLVAN